MDPYQVLGVDRAAADDDIRKAFRRLAKAYHPDLNPADDAAAEQFRRLSAAYEIVGDPPRRRQYDCGEIDAFGQPRAPYAYDHGWTDPAREPAGAGAGASSAFTGFSDIFEEMFGGGPQDGLGGYGNDHDADAWHDHRTSGRRNGQNGASAGVRGNDVRYGLEIDFMEALEGTKKRVTLPNGGVLDLTVPAGILHGQVLRLRGKGSPGVLGGAAGDALVEIKVKPHKIFSRVGNDIHADAPVTLDEAVLGGKIEVSTVQGRVQLTLPPGVANGRVFRLRGKGVPVETAGTKAGDHFVTIRIVMPETVDEDLRSFFADWRQRHGYAPGAR